MFPLNRYNNNNNRKQFSKYLTYHHPRHRKWFFWRNFRLMLPERILAPPQWVAARIWTNRPTCLVIWMTHACQVMTGYEKSSREFWGIKHSGNLRCAMRSIFRLNVSVSKYVPKTLELDDSSGKETDQRRKDFRFVSLCCQNLEWEIWLSLAQ